MEHAETLGRFEIVRQLGRGAMGVVYLARDPVLDRRVAIKAIQIHPGLSEEHVGELRQRFVNEARSAANLSHPNLVTIYDAGFDDDQLYIAMELVDGESLEGVIEAERVLSYKEISDLVLQLGSALDHAHRHGVVHRDIKPANVLIDRHGKPKIADFGVARQATSTLTATGTIIGTPSYMSPEQITGHLVTGASDQFALAIVVYEVLTGRKPFDGDGATTVLYRIVHEEPPRPLTVRASLPPAVDDVVMRALSKEPEGRYGSCSEMAEALREALKAAPPSEVEALVTGTRAAGEDATAVGTHPPARMPEGRTVAPEASPRAATTAPGPGRPRWLIPAAVSGVALVILVVAGIWLGNGDEVPAGPAHIGPAEVEAAAGTAAGDGLAGGALAEEAGAADSGAENRGAAAGASALQPPEPSEAVYRITSRPDGARITLDGRVLADRTPVEVALDPKARHTLRLEMDGRVEVNWAFVPEELSDEQQRERLLFFPMRETPAPATTEEGTVENAPEPASEPLEPVDPQRIRGGIEPPEALEKVEPVLPDWAAEQGLAKYGVVLEIVVDKRGRVRSARVLRPVHPDLEQMATEAVLRWRFEPATRDGQPIDVFHNLTVLFRPAAGG